ncbi:MAG: sulfurtransferase-like selenium metabolism protein YedF [Thermodesulfobacteriota bacterium]
MKEIDCRGLACPQPVITTKNALEEIEQGEFILIVDNPSARDNVERFAQSQGARVTIKKKENDFYLHIEKRSMSDRAETPQKAEKVVVYINSNLLGVGEEALGSILMRSFLKTLLDLETKPFRLIFINSGVRLTTEGSEVLETLKTMDEKGVEILSCGTCLDFYGLKEKLKVGIISNMYDIAQSLLEADRLIKT